MTWPFHRRATNAASSKSAAQVDSRDWFCRSAWRVIADRRSAIWVMPMNRTSYLRSCSAIAARNPLLLLSRAVSSSSQAQKVLRSSRGVSWRESPAR
ncbi:hypothetical protein [Streptomyces sp. ID05-18]|uniref:hypothetical protein n=1 Tax=Streptomyces sp. ID05-18 TaxID=3028662 RepID=UPI0029A35E6A|nr:hypothetical protein [Streptomyces sp. ID05-18]MDX3488345.1 hypothetical protein [Streptomyces sp. ID05-18]